jgi:hypothetical protein
LPHTRTLAGLVPDVAALGDQPFESLGLKGTNQIRQAGVQLRRLADRLGESGEDAALPATPAPAAVSRRPPGGIDARRANLIGPAVPSLLFEDGCKRRRHSLNIC